MNQITSTNRHDFSQVVALINHVFGKEHTTTKMEDIFTDLLCLDNGDHMRIIKVDDQPVSVVNYLINDIDIHGCTIKAASIGAVCTHEDYRHRGYSNQILRNCLDKMKQEEVDFLYVSGEIDLYTKNNIHITGKMHPFNIELNQLKQLTDMMNELQTSCTVRVCTQADTERLHAIYEAEEVKFIRDKQRFSDLLSRVPGASVFDRPSNVFCIEENGHIEGYIICAILPTENDNFEIELIEYAGNRSLIIAGMVNIIQELSPSRFCGYTSWYDNAMLKVLDDYNIDIEATYYPGTMRIINFSQFMQKLKPMFSGESALNPISLSADNALKNLAVSDVELNNLAFFEENGNYIIQQDNTKCVIHDDMTMHTVFLGNGMLHVEAENFEQVSFEKNHLTGDTNLYTFLKQLLPIPVPYPNNLNYI